MAEVLIFNDINGLLGFGRYSGPYRIASELRMHGFDVQVVEFFASMSIDEFKNVIDRFVDNKTLIVGIGSTLLSKNYSDEELISLIKLNNSWMQILNSSYVDLFPQNQEFIDIFFDYIKSKNNNTKIVVGGYKAQKASVVYSLVDYWILGQGDSSIVALCNHLKYGSSLKTFKTNSGNFITDKIYPYNNFSCSKITWQDNDLLFENESVPIETARGCIFKCSFCSFNLNGKKFREYNKSSNTLRNEMIYNYDNYGITDYMIADDTLNDSEEKINHLYDTIKSLPFKITFSAYCRLDIISSHFDMAYKLQEIGLTSVNFGIETFNKDAGKAIGKGSSSEKLQTTLSQLKKLWKNDVYMSAGFIVGLPFESIESIRNTFNYLYSNENPLTAVGVYRLYVQTPTFIEVDDKNICEATNAGFVKYKDKIVYDNLSKLAIDPLKYNYQVNDNTWVNEQMSVEDALNLVNEFYSSKQAPQKYSMTYFQDYNRIKNLGFNHGEVINMYNNNINQVLDCISRRKTLRNNYFNRLLK